MKHMLAVCGLFMAISNAHADVTCSNGTFEQMGDGHYSIDLLKNGIEFRPYEGFFSVDAADIVYNSGTYSIVNKTVNKSSEGTESKEVVNATLIFNEAKMTLNVAISDNKGPFRTYEMTCTKK